MEHLEYWEKFISYQNYLYNYNCDPLNAVITTKICKNMYKESLMPAVVQTIVFLTRQKLDEITDIDKNAENTFSCFATFPKSIDSLPEIRFQILEGVLEMYPRAILCRDIYIWNLRPNLHVDELRESIMLHLCKRPLFKGRMEITFSQLHDIPAGIINSWALPMFINYDDYDINLNSVILKWILQDVNQPNWPAKSLKEIALTATAKFVLDLTIRSHNQNLRENDFFVGYRGLFYYYMSGKLNLYNIYLLLNLQMIPVITDRYRNTLDSLSIPSELKESLKNYFPPKLTKDHTLFNSIRLYFYSKGIALPLEYD